MNEQLIQGMRWAARVIGTLMVALFLFIFTGEALTDGIEFSGLLGLSLGEYLEFLAVFVMMVGAVLAWWRELAGGLLCIVGGSGFNLIESLQAGGVDLFWFPLVFVGIGLIFVLCSQVETPNHLRHA